MDVRARRTLLLGLKYVLKNWGYDNIKVDETITKLTVGGEIVAEAYTVERVLNIKWSEDWESWDEFMNSEEVKEQVEKSKKMMERSISKGKGKAVSKGGTHH